MEVHVQLKTKSGMFCGCKNDPDEKEPNINTCPVCLGLPGGLPVANKRAIEWTIMLGLALGCKINRFSKFDRKHYFYPDLAKGYQISQYSIPFCYDGKIETSFGSVKITRVHLEEDTGKLIHQKVNGHNVSLIDFNRSGVPLVEIVTEPEIYSSAQAKEYAKKLRQIIRYLDISNCDMEKGGMRLEANISLAKVSQEEDSSTHSLRSFGRNDKQAPASSRATEESRGILPNYKVELKNINSFRFLERGIEYEIKRQKEILESGKTPAQETRGYNSEKNITYSQRSKESAADYRYFPDPDLPPIRINEEWMKEIKKDFPESLDELFSKWQKKYNLSQSSVELLFETASESRWLNSLFEETNKQKLPVDKLVNYFVHKKIGTVPFRDSLLKVISEYQKTTAVDDIGDEELIVTIKKVLAANQKAVTDYKTGKTQVVNFLFGQVAKEAKRKLDFKKIIDLIKTQI